MELIPTSFAAGTSDSRAVFWEHCPVLNTPYSYTFGHEQHAPHSSSQPLSHTSETSSSRNAGLDVTDPLCGVGERGRARARLLHAAAAGSAERSWRRTPQRCSRAGPGSAPASHGTPGRGGETAPTSLCCLPTRTPYSSPLLLRKARSASPTALGLSESITDKARTTRSPAIEKLFQVPSCFQRVMRCASCEPHVPSIEQRLILPKLL